MNPLTYEQALLIQRHFDGDLAVAEEQGVTQMLGSNRAAQEFLSMLEELRLSVQCAEDAIWARAASTDPHFVAQRAMDAEPLTELPLDGLTALLERFHDAETTAEESLFVEILLEQRDDVARYLEGLATLRNSMIAADNLALDTVDLDGLWDRVEAEIGESDSDQVAFDPAEHQFMLQRYVDGEVKSGERARVEEWIRAENDQVLSTLAAYDSIRLAANAAVEFAQESVDLDRILAGVDAVLDEEVSASDKVVSLDAERSRSMSWNQPVVLLAAAVMLVFFVNQFTQSSSPREVIIKEKTVVIVDSVEYAPGASVMVNSIQPAGFEQGGETPEEPTVIWLLDDDEPTAEPKSDDLRKADPDAGSAVDEADEQPI